MGKSSLSLVSFFQISKIKTIQALFTINHVTQISDLLPCKIAIEDQAQKILNNFFIPRFEISHIV
jgi:hypothetical protein